MASIGKRDWVKLLPLGWVLAYFGLYAVRLPVTYQHGRYAIPTIPILMVIGIGGMLHWIELKSLIGRKRILSRVWLLTSLAVLVSFVVVGGLAYGNDVAIIETEMVAAAQWIKENTPETALIAAHDIGALGFYGERDILDLAGLISPEVIPFIRDQQRLADFIQDNGASYLMTFPEWYPDLVQHLDPVFVSGGDFSPAAGGENMVIYRWRE
jgi:hypothetical protein